MADYIIFDKKTLKEHFVNITQRRSWDVFAALASAIISTVAVAFSDVPQKIPGGQPVLMKGIFFLIAVVQLGYLIKILVDKVKSNKIDTVDELNNHTGLPKEYTCLFLIFNRGGDQIEILLNRKESSSAYYLPYIKFDPTKEGFDIKAEIKSFVKGLSGLEDNYYTIERRDEFDISDLQKIDNNDSSKAKIYFHKFYQIKFNISFNDLKADIKTKKQTPYSWHSLKKWLNDPGSKVFNKEVIKSIEDGISELSSCFEGTQYIADSPLRGMKIIWNITSKCHYNCEVCATQKNCKKNIDFDIKHRLFSELVSSRLSCLDFSGGDPLLDSDFIKLITRQSAQTSLQSTSITTTGASVTQIMSQDKIFNNIKAAFDLTIDYPWPDSPHRRIKADSIGIDDYNQNNIDTALKLKEKGRRVNIHLPLFPKLIESNTHLSDMVNKINKIKPEQVTLLRYMPVGAAQSLDHYDYDQYDPRDAVQYLKDNINDAIPVKLHCALRVICDNNPKNKCTMLTNKLGIDQEANLYACAWGAYIHDGEVNDNPFFLGSLRQKDIREVIGYQKYSKLKQKNDTCDNDFCKVISYYYAKRSTMNMQQKVEALFINYDKLTPKSK